MSARQSRVAGRSGRVNRRAPDGDPRRETDRRSFIVGGIAFIGGVLSGAATTYLGDYLGIIVPPAEVADLQANEPAARAIVLVERNVATQGSLWIFPYLLSRRPALLERVTESPLSGQGELNYYYTNGASDINVTHCKLILEGRRNIEIRLIDIRAVILKRSERLGEGASVLTPGPQGQEESLELGFDLDGSTFSAKAIVDPASIFDDVGFFGDRIFQETTVALARNEQQAFQVTARSLKYYVEWSLEVDLIINGELEVLSIDANGRPFRTCGAYPESEYGDPTAPDEKRYSEVYLQKGFDPKFDSASTAERTEFIRIK